jgi:hypothetical protein
MTEVAVLSADVGLQYDFTLLFLCKLILDLFFKFSPCGGG